jgi:hypothetical protein
VSSQCFGERPDGGQTDDVTYGHAPEEQHTHPVMVSKTEFLRTTWVLCIF